VLFTLLVCVVPIAVGQGAPTDLDAAALEAFFAETVPTLMDEHRVPGAAVAVVASGEIRLATGYGLAELDPDRPASADTPFATGSIAKLFTWTAVMQLVERSEIDLDADVNTYLDFEIPATFGAPVTVRDLMTHTPGFEDYPMVGVFSRDAGGLPELGEVLAARVPDRIWEPGVESAYSNYGTALAGYIVERVSGIPFAQYVDRNIFEPLGMERSSFLQPLPPQLAAVAARGYVPDGDEGWFDGGSEYLTLSPAGGMVMSVSDAARFMLAHLGGRALDASPGGARILEDETVERMHTTLFRHLPTLPGNAHGFWESERHGERIVLHSGDTQLYASKLTLLPDRGVGMYVATNAPGGFLLREGLWEAFLDRFYPVPAPAAMVDLNSAELSRYAGSYGMNRASTSSFAKILTLFGPLRVSAEEGLLVTSIAGMRNTWVPQGDGRFADIAREGEVALFTTDAAGRTVAYFSEAPMMVFRPLRWFETPTFNFVLILGSSVLLLSALIVVPLLAWRGRRRSEGVDGWAGRGRWLAPIAALLLLAFIGLFFTAMLDPLGPAFGVSPLLALGLGLGVAGALAVAALALLTLVAWLIGWWRTGERIYVTVVTVAGLALLWQMNHWNLLGFRI
jgi:CubicO group peptidase (beta-lactamase class C family)